MRAKEFTEETTGDLIRRLWGQVHPGSSSDSSTPSPTVQPAPSPLKDKTNKPNPPQQGASSLFSNLRWPVQGKFERGFGSDNGRHKGVDISAPVGTPVRTTTQGRIGRVDRIGGTANGKFVTVINGSEEYLFLHLSQTLASPGQAVQSGDVIGLVGSTGFSTGPHLHWQKHVNGRPVDPLRY